MLHRHQRLNFSGSVHFITTVARVRGAWFVQDAVCREILQSFEWYRSKFDVVCIGFVLMPDHLHSLLIQRDGDAAISRMIGLFKSYTSRFIDIPSYPQGLLWRDYFDDVPVPGPKAARTKLNYIHQNPFRKGMVEEEGDYTWSSIHDYLDSQNGIVTVNRVDAIAGL